MASPRVRLAVEQFKSQALAPRATGSVSVPAQRDLINDVRTVKSPPGVSELRKCGPRLTLMDVTIQVRKLLVQRVAEEKQEAASLQVRRRPGSNGL